MAVFMVFMVSSVALADRTFVWNANTETNVGYKLYDITDVNNPVLIADTSNVTTYTDTATITDMRTYCLKAYWIANPSLESACSLSVTPPPVSPDGFTIIIITP